jgi:hypothetical protein
VAGLFFKTENNEDSKLLHSADHISTCGKAFHG